MTAKVEQLSPTVWFRLQEETALDNSAVADSGYGIYTGAAWRFFSDGDKWQAQQVDLTPWGDPCVFVPQDNPALTQTRISTFDSTYGMELFGSSGASGAAVVSLLYRAPEGFYFNLGESQLPHYDGLLIADDSAQFSTTDAANYLTPTSLHMMYGVLYSIIAGQSDTGTYGEVGEFVGVYRWTADTFDYDEVTYSVGTTPFSAIGGYTTHSGRQLTVFTHSTGGGYADNKSEWRHLDRIAHPIIAVAPTTSTSGTANEAHESTSADAGWWTAASGADGVGWSGRGYKTTATTGGSRIKVYKTYNAEFPPNEAKMLYSMDVVGMPAHAGGGGFSAVVFNGNTYAMFSIDSGSGASVIPLAENVGDSDLYTGLTAANMTYIGNRVDQIGVKRSVYSNGTTTAVANAPLNTISHGYGLLQVLGSRLFLFLRGMHRIAHTLDGVTWEYTELPSGWDLIGVHSPTGAVSEFLPLYEDKLYFLAQNRFVDPAYQLYRITEVGVIEWVYTLPLLSTLTSCTSSNGGGLVCEYTNGSSSVETDRSGESLRSIAAYFRCAMADGKWDVYLHSIPVSAWFTTSGLAEYDAYAARMGLTYRWKLGQVTIPGETEVSIGVYPLAAIIDRTGPSGWIVESASPLVANTQYPYAVRLSNARVDTGVPVTPEVVSAGYPNTVVDAFVTIGVWIKCAIGGTLSDIILTNDSTALATTYYGAHVSVNTTTGIVTIRYGSGAGTGVSSYRIYTTADTGIRADGVGRFFVFQSRVVAGTIDLQPSVWVNGVAYTCSYSSGSLASVQWPTTGVRGVMFGAGYDRVSTLLDCTMDDIFIHFGFMTTAEVQALYAAGT